jgi:uncharacterized protein with von Willebrand factor type A (vWA) domain
MDNSATGVYLMQHLLAFSHLLRAMGIDVGPGQDLELVRALEYVPITSRDDFRSAARCLLIRRREDLPLFDVAFSFYWRSASQYDPLMMAIPVVNVPGRQLRLPRRPRDQPPPPPDEPREEQREELGLTLVYNANEQLRHKDFGNFSYEEVQACRELLRKLIWRISERRTRRRQSAPHGRQIDMRRTFRRNLRYGGQPIELSRREVQTQQRPLVVLCDISGSMDRYSRILLQFIHTISDGLRHVEAFVFGTRLTRLTRLLREQDIDDAVGAVSKQVVDWSGGTRIGETLKQFNYQWSRRVLGRGAVVLLISDGWDRGDPKILSREMSRLQRSCHRLIWLNPLLGSPGYEPLTLGMQAALPHVDDFLPVHNLVSLEQLGERLSALGSAKPTRRQRRMVEL